MGEKVVTLAVVRAMAEEYSRADLVTARKAGLAAVLGNLPRVELTSMNFKDGGSAGVFVDADPAYIVELLTAAIDYLDAEADGDRANPAMNHADFSHRPVGW